MRAPDHLQTERLSLRRPRSEDAEDIFARYANDPEVTRYVGWPRHVEVDETIAFLGATETEWQRDGVGAYLIFRAGRLLGGTGLHRKSDTLAMTGYVLARDAWGQGFATEALHAMLLLAEQIGLQRLEACCYVEHTRSRRVLEKGGFALESIATCGTPFPQLPHAIAPVCNYARELG